MSELETLQLAFGRYLFTGDPAITTAVVTTAQMDATRRLSIYSNAYRARLSDVLATDYPVLRAVLGGATFDALCVEYIASLAVNLVHATRLWPTFAAVDRASTRYRRTPLNGRVGEL